MANLNNLIRIRPEDINKYLTQYNESLIDFLKAYKGFLSQEENKEGLCWFLGKSIYLFCSIHYSSDQYVFEKLHWQEISSIITNKFPYNGVLDLHGVKKLVKMCCVDKVSTPVELDVMAVICSYLNINMYKLIEIFISGAEHKFSKPISFKGCYYE